MHLSPVSITAIGSVIIRHLADFDALVAEARGAGLDLHPNVIARNWIVRPQRSTIIQAVTVAFDVRVSVESARAKLAAQGLRPCTPHEALCIAIDRTDFIKATDHYHVALDTIWTARDGDAALTMFDFCGTLHVGTSPCDGTWPERIWNFLAVPQR